MLVLIVLWISVCIQFVSVYFSLRLIKVIGGKLAWITLSAAIFLMAVRRSISLYHAYDAFPVISKELYPELVALIISICILIGVIAIGPLFKRFIKSEVKLTEQMRRNQIFINTTPDAFMLTDIKGNIFEVNKAFNTLFNRSHETTLHNFSELLSPAQNKKFLSEWELLLTAKQCRVVIRYLNTSLLSLELNAKLIDIEGDALVYVFIQDVTEREEMELRLFKQKERAQVTLESITDGVITTDKKGIIRFVNSSVINFFGRDVEALIGETLKRVLCSDCGQVALSNQPLHKLVIKCISQKKTLSLSNQVIKDSLGKVHYFDIIISLLKSKDNFISGAVLVLRDITTIRQMEEELSYQSTHDPLTNLINRGAFEKKLERLFEDVKLQCNEHAILNISLDEIQLQLIMDSCGQDAKDELLKKISTRLEKIIGKKDDVTFFDQSNFKLIIEDINVNQAEFTSEKIISALKNDKFEWSSVQYELNICIGIAMLNKDTTTTADVLNFSLSACHIARQNGKNQYHIHSENDNHSGSYRSQKLRLNMVQNAIDEERFKLFKQPICNLQIDDTDENCEVLIRMLGDNDEIISPVDFLPIAEQYHLMPIIDRWVVRETLFLIRDNSFKLLDQSHCSINLSGQTLGDESFLDEVLVLFVETKVPFSKICFEITETALISNFKYAQEFISTLRMRGCKFSLDDFGSGLSSFSYLKDLPVDYLKIDGSFVLGILSDKRDYNLVKSIHQIANLMGMETVAEFIESEAMIDCIRKMGIQYGQGYALGKPESIVGMTSEA